MKFLPGGFLIEHVTQGDYRLLVFTDLDGTLLDHETYSFEPALPAISVLKENTIPIIFCTSKTRSETEKIRLQLGNTHPFISENGGALFIPRGYFSHSFHFTKEDSDYQIIELGTTYVTLRKVMNEMCTLFPDKIKGFGDLTSQEIADLCGFSLSHATLAKKREYDEPFILKDEACEEAIREIAGRSNLHINRGGRFHHLIGRNDKGQAALLLKDIYRQKSSDIKTIALGDSQNDLPMLEVADYPVLVQKPGGSYDPSVTLDNLILAPGSGPAGWGEAILELLNKLD
jgi:mannosyl-3-phosphoglycerate phosphatase